jgi:DNA-directed RNA polymerase subunit beta'
MKYKNLTQVYKILFESRVNFDELIPFTHNKKTLNQQKNLRIGRVIFNMLLPEDYPLVDYTVGKKEIKVIISDILQKYSAQVALETVEKINKESLFLATLAPPTISMEDLIIPDFILKKKEQILNEDLEPSDFVDKLEALAKELLEHMKSKKSGLFELSASGSTSKASPLGIAVLLLAKGPSTDIEGNLTKPIMNSVTDGFTLEEFYANASETRAALYTRSAATAEPGDLARGVAFANSNVTISKKDCGTENYLKLTEYQKDILLEKLNSFKQVKKEESETEKEKNKLTENDSEILNNNFK